MIYHCVSFRQGVGGKSHFQRGLPQRVEAGSACSIALQRFQSTMIIDRFPHPSTAKACTNCRSKSACMKQVGWKMYPCMILYLT